VLAVNFYYFYHQHFSGFHTFMVKIMLRSFTLMSSTSFGDYLIFGAQCTKFGQKGENPRPAGLTLRQTRLKLHHQVYKLKSKPLKPAHHQGKHPTVERLGP
jgi:hypothetical protein